MRATIALLLLLSSGAGAQHTRSLAGAAPPPASVDQLAWLAGSWVGSGMGAEVTET